MAEVQQTSSSSEMTKRFIEFVMMQAQQISLFLGKLPHPQGEKIEPNLDLARLFIDQLAMIQEKTRGNLTKDEEQILNSVLSDLQLVYVEVAKSLGGASSAPAASSVSAPEAPAAPQDEKPPGGDDDDHKKRFTKSYG